ncbi:MAG: formyl transferase [Flavobacteriales bacterium]|nr:formyl transferase [Flavobacteriales bacterium]
MPERIVLLARESAATAILYNALVAHFDVRVVYEQPPSTMHLLRSRVRRLGIWRVFGQVLFQVLIAKPLGALSQARRTAILADLDASDAAIPHHAIARTATVNDPLCWELVRALAPRAVVINGTRILSAKTIAALGVPILNTHVGITPMYRGVHGAYWALAQGDRQHCGVTVHLVDEGIDTGGILYQQAIDPTPQDNFSTYPTMQMAVGSKLMVRALHDVLSGTLRPHTAEGTSRRWEIPTLWAYLANWLRGAK